MRTKKCKNSKAVAEVCDCNVRMVNYVLSGQRGNRRVTKLAEKIELAAALLDERIDVAKAEVRKIVNA